jgi:hypothetical protein
MPSIPRRVTVGAAIWVAKTGCFPGISTRFQQSDKKGGRKDISHPGRVNLLKLRCGIMLLLIPPSNQTPLRTVSDHQDTAIFPVECPGVFIKDIFPADDDRRGLGEDVLCPRPWNKRDAPCLIPAPVPPLGVRPTTVPFR